MTSEEGDEVSQDCSQRLPEVKHEMPRLQETCVARGGAHEGGARVPKRALRGYLSRIERQKTEDVSRTLHSRSLTLSGLSSIIIGQHGAGPSGDCPGHWVDVVHEADGGSDRYGMRPQDGREVHRHTMNAFFVKEGQAEAVDDVSGESLRPDLVREARMLEMKYFQDRKVYDHVPRSSIAATGGDSSE